MSACTRRVRRSHASGRARWMEEARRSGSERTPRSSTAAEGSLLGGPK